MQVFERNILGCFVSSNLNDGYGHIFRKYIWGEHGISEPLKKLKYEKYGSDLTIILVQFFVNPIPYQLNSLKSIENYRRDERSIGVAIVVNDENFFSRPEIERWQFITGSILNRLDMVKEVVRKKKLDTNVDLLKIDVTEIFERI